MSRVSIDQLPQHIDGWVSAAPTLDDLGATEIDAMSALIDAGMVQYEPNGWLFKLHESMPDAPKSQFKLMIREADGVNTDPAFYDRFVLPSVYQAEAADRLHGSDGAPAVILGYPNAGTAIAEAFVRVAKRETGIELVQAVQTKVNHDDGSRELGEIVTDLPAGTEIRALDDTATGGQTKVEGHEKITQQGFGYAGLMLVVERDPIGSALVREKTGKPVDPSLHWLSIVAQAASQFDLPSETLQREIDYTRRLFEWKVANGKTGELPSDPQSLRSTWA